MTTSFARLCDEAAAVGSRISIEIIAFSNIASPDRALAIIEGADQPNGGLLLDIWHLERKGIDAAQIAAPPERLIFGLELNDAIDAVKGHAVRRHGLSSPLLRRRRLRYRRLRRCRQGNGLPRPLRHRGLIRRRSSNAARPTRANRLSKHRAIRQQITIGAHPDNRSGLRENAAPALPARSDERRDIRGNADPVADGRPPIGLRPRNRRLDRPDR